MQEPPKQPPVLDYAEIPSEKGRPFRKVGQVLLLATSLGSTAASLPFALRAIDAAGDAQRLAGAVTRLEHKATGNQLKGLQDREKIELHTAKLDGATAIALAATGATTGGCYGNYGDHKKETDSIPMEKFFNDYFSL